MCDVCQRSPCHPCCPNAPAAVRIYDCEWCDEGIVQNEEYVKIGGNYYHRDGCFADWLNDQSISALADMLGGSIGTAQDQYYFEECV